MIYKEPNGKVTGGSSISWFLADIGTKGGVIATIDNLSDPEAASGKKETELF